MIVGFVEHQRLRESVGDSISEILVSICSTINQQQYVPKMPVQSELGCVFETRVVDVQPYLFKVSLIRFKEFNFNYYPKNWNFLDRLSNNWIRKCRFARGFGFVHGKAIDSRYFVFMKNKNNNNNKLSSRKILIRGTLSSWKKFQLE